jgi:hypothetical protein
MIPFQMTVDQAGEGAVDFSYLLDAPAGKHGFVRNKDGHFTFADGTRIRFFGVNLVFGAAMPERKMAVKIADRLATSGINMVRLHHVDSYQVGEGTNTIIDYSGGNSQKLHEANMDRLDFLVAELKRRGIYIHIDLFTLRKYLPGDRLDYEDELGGALKHFNYFNRRLIDLHKKFAEQYLTHLNPYTGLRYVDDPAIAVVQLLNENGIFWENGDSAAPSYRKELDRRWNEWLLKRYGDRERLDQAWTKEDGTKALSSDEDPGQNTVRRPEIGFWGEKRIDWRTDYASVDGPARFADHIRFLSEIQLAYHEEMSGYLRSIGVKCPINASNLPSGAAELRCDAAGDVTENNCYWNHPMGGFRVSVEFHRQEMVSTDPRQIHVKAFAMNMITKLSIARVQGKPFVVTEWNVCWPTKFRADVMLMLSSYAALQDWDGLILFSFAHSGGDELSSADAMSGFFNSFNDPAVWGLAGVASAIFQGRLVKEADRLIEIGYSQLDVLQTHPAAYLPFGSAPFISRVAARFLEDDRYDGPADVALSSGFTATGDYRKAKHAIVYSRSPYKDAYQKEKGIEEFLALHQGENLVAAKDAEALDRDPGALPALLSDSMKRWGLLQEDRGYDAHAQKYVSDTGELAFHFGEGRFQIVTDHIVSFAGDMREEREAAGFRLRLSNKKAAVTFLSRDGLPLHRCRQMMITAVGESENVGMRWDGDTLIDEGTGPVVIDQIQGILRVPSDAAACKAYVLDASGRRRELLRTEKTEDGFAIYLEHQEAAIYYELELI